MVLILGIAIISALVHNAYVSNGHKLHITPTDAPIGRNANNAPEADSPGLDPMFVPKADALHVSQTYAPTGRSAEDFPSQADSPSGKSMHEHKTKSSCLPQKETTVHPSTTDVPTKDAATGRNADNFPQAGNPSGMKRKHVRKTKSSRLNLKENTVYPRKTVSSKLPQEFAPFDWSKIRYMWLGEEYD